MGKFRLFYKATAFWMVVAMTSASLRLPPAQAGELTAPVLPVPGTMVSLSPAYGPALLKGLIMHSDNALKFDFIVARGQGRLTEDEKKLEYKKLVKYFLASLAVPDQDQWVNLSPYEKTRIIEADFGQTAMGQDLLAQDYLLKQVSSSLIYPEKSLGKKFWDEVYKKTYQAYGRADVAVNTFNKVWIVPDRATIYEKGNTAYILDNHLKVMLEEDYLSLRKHAYVGVSEGGKTRAPSFSAPPRAGFCEHGGETRGQDPNICKLGSEMIRSIILPALEKEVNEGKNFAPLRQVYSGMLLAAWYKRALKESLLGKVYADKDKVKGVDRDPKNNEIIYERYLRAFKKGVFNFVKEEAVSHGTTLPRKYFSGGTRGYADYAQIVKVISILDPAQTALVAQNLKYEDLAAVSLREEKNAVDEAMLMPSAKYNLAYFHWDRFINHWADYLSRSQFPMMMRLNDSPKNIRGFYQPFRSVDIQRMLAIGDKVKSDPDQRGVFLEYGAGSAIGSYLLASHGRVAIAVEGDDEYVARMAPLNDLIEVQPGSRIYLSGDHHLPLIFMAGRVEDMEFRLDELKRAIAFNREPKLEFWKHLDLSEVDVAWDAYQPQQANWLALQEAVHPRAIFHIWNCTTGSVEAYADTPAYPSILYWQGPSQYVNLSSYFHLQVRSDLVPEMERLDSSGLEKMRPQEEYSYLNAYIELGKQEGYTVEESRVFLQRPDEIFAGSPFRHRTHEQMQEELIRQSIVYGWSMPGRDHVIIAAQLKTGSRMVAYVQVSDNSIQFKDWEGSLLPHGLSDIKSLDHLEIVRPEQNVQWGAQTAKQALETLTKWLYGNMAMTSQEMRKHMAELSEGKGSWEDKRGQWVIGSVIYSPGKIQMAGLIDREGRAVQKDEFGDYPSFVYTLRNKLNHRFVYVGYDDALSLYSDKSDQTEINRLRNEKVAQRSTVFTILETINLLRGLLGVYPINEEINGIIQNIKTVRNPQELIGDRHFARIQEASEVYAHAWKADFHETMPLERFLVIVEDLRNAIKIPRWGRIPFIFKEAQEQVSAILTRTSQPLTPKEVEILAAVHQRIADVKYSNEEASRRWALRQATRVSEEDETRRSAFHANIWAAHWLKEHFQGQTPRILDVGANDSVLWSILGTFDPTLAEGVIDLEKEKGIYETASNPHRIHADIADLNRDATPRILASSDPGTEDYVKTPHQMDVITANFVLDLLEPKEIRQALKAFEMELADGGRLIVTSPEGSPLQNSNIERVLKEIGYDIESQGANLSNELSPEAKERISREEGPAQLREIERVLTKKIYHAAVYKKVRAVPLEKIDRIDLNRLIIRQNPSRRRTVETKTPIARDMRFTAQELVNLDILGQVHEEDFVVQSLGDIVTRQELRTLPEYEGFARDLTTLIWFRGILQSGTQSGLSARLRELRFLNEIQELIDSKAVYLPRHLVDSVMKLATRNDFGLTFAQIQEVLPQVANDSQWIGIRDREQRQKRRDIVAETDQDYQRQERAVAREFENRIYPLLVLTARVEQINKERREPSLLNGNNVFRQWVMQEFEDLVDEEGKVIPGVRLSPDALSVLRFNQFTRKGDVITPQTEKVLREKDIWDAPVINLLRMGKIGLAQIGISRGPIDRIETVLRPYRLDLGNEHQERAEEDQQPSKAFQDAIDAELRDYLTGPKESTDTPGDSLTPEEMEAAVEAELGTQGSPAKPAEPLPKILTDMFDEDGKLRQGAPVTRAFLSEVSFQQLAQSVGWELTVRTANCLKNDGLLETPLEGLLEKTETEILRTPNFGRKSLREVTDILALFGLVLASVLPTEPQTVVSVTKGYQVPVPSPRPGPSEPQEGGGRIELTEVQMRATTTQKIFRDYNIQVNRRIINILRRSHGYLMRYGEALDLWNSPIAELFDTSLEAFLLIRDADESDYRKLSDVLYEKFGKKLSFDLAMNGWQKADVPGGIDLNAGHLELIIKRDGHGAPLPLSQQDLAQLGQIQGFEPDITSIRPAK